MRSKRRRSSSEAVSLVAGALIAVAAVAWFARGLLRPPPAPAGVERREIGAVPEPGRAEVSVVQPELASSVAAGPAAGLAAAGGPAPSSSAPPPESRGGRGARRPSGEPDAQADLAWHLTGRVTGPDGAVGHAEVLLALSTTSPAERRRSLEAFPLRPKDRDRADAAGFFDLSFEARDDSGDGTPDGEQRAQWELEVRAPGYASTRVRGVLDPKRRSQDLGEVRVDPGGELVVELVDPTLKALEAGRFLVVARAVDGESAGSSERDVLGSATLTAPGVAHLPSLRPGSVQIEVFDSGRQLVALGEACVLSGSAVPARLVHDGADPARRVWARVEPAVLARALDLGQLRLVGNGLVGREPDFVGATYAAFDGLDNGRYEVGLLDPICDFTSTQGYPGGPPIVVRLSGNAGVGELSEGAELEGRVVDETERFGLGDVQVELLRASQQAETALPEALQVHVPFEVWKSASNALGVVGAATTTTETDGHFLLGPLPAGSYLLVARDGEHCYAGRRIEVADGRSETRIALPPTRRLAGRIWKAPPRAAAGEDAQPGASRADGVPLRCEGSALEIVARAVPDGTVGAKVGGTVEGTDEQGAALAATPVGADGGFAFDPLPLGQVSLALRLSGSGSDDAAGLELELGAARVERGVAPPLELIAAGCERVHARVAVSGVGSSTIRVHWTPVAGTPLKGRASAELDPQGRARVALFAATYAVDLEDVRGAWRWRARARWSPGSQETLDVSLELCERRLRFVDAAGAPLAHTRVRWSLGSLGSVGSVGSVEGPVGAVARTDGAGRLALTLPATDVWFSLAGNARGAGSVRVDWSAPAADDPETVVLALTSR